jgi:multiple sugar transport system substrate-binding protein
MKKITVILTVLMLTLALSACGSKTKYDLYNYQVDTEITGDVTITFWHAFGQANQDSVDQYIASFKAEYPNITVLAQSQGGYRDLRSKVVKSIVSGDTPTMLIGYPDHVADYIQGEAILSLDPFINSSVGYTEEELSDFVDSYLEENNQFGHIMGLPFNKSTEVLIYNKTFFDLHNIAVPVTWDDVEAASRTIKTETGKWGFAYDSASNVFITLVRQWGGAYTNIDGELLFNNPQAEAALKYYQDMHKAGLFTFPAEWETNYASEPFKNKEVYMTVGSTAGIRYNVPTNVNNMFEIGVAPIPQFDENNKQVIQQGTNMSIMANSSDQERLAAWLFIKHLASKEVTLDWSMETGYLPVRKSALESTEYQNFLNNPDHDDRYISMAANAAYSQVNYMFYDSAFVGSSNVRDEVGLAFEAVLYSGKTPKQALDEAISELDW